MRVLRRVWCVIGLGVLWYSMVPLPAAAQASPATNPICWSKEACQAQFKQSGWTFTENNFLKGQPAECTVGGSDWGACVPISKTQLAIRFNGVDTVQNIADYMRILYVYIVGVAGLIAAFLIVKGGLEYITAGGESGRITSAKATLGSATLGLVLVFGSYVILNTINPDLVNLHVPNTYMLRAITLGGGFCQDVSVPKDSSGNEKKFAVAKQGADPAKATYDYTKEETTCGKQFFIPDGAGQTCRGKSCANAKWCKGYDEKSYQTLTDEERAQQTNCTCLKEGDTYTCDQSTLSGTIYTKDTKIAEIWLKVLCANDSVQPISDTNSFGAKLTDTTYKFINVQRSSLGSKSIADTGAEECDGAQNVKGYFFILDVSVKGTYITGASHNQWVGGKSLCSNPSCPWYGRILLNTSQAEDFINKVIPNYAEGILFTQDELQNGFTCDLNVTPQFFEPVGGVFSPGATQSFPCGVNQTIPPPSS